MKMWPFWSKRHLFNWFFFAPELSSFKFCLCNLTLIDSVTSFFYPCVLHAFQQIANYLFCFNDLLYSLKYVLLHELLGTTQSCAISWAYVFFVAGD